MTLRVEYEFGLDDLKAFYTWLATHDQRYRTAQWKLRCLSVPLALVVVWRFRDEWTLPAVLGGLIGLGLALVFVSRINRWWYVRRNMQVQSGPDGHRAGRVTLVLEDEALTADAPEGTTRHRMPAIRRIKSCDSHHFIFLGPYAAITVPRAAENADALVAALRSRIG